MIRTEPVRDFAIISDVEDDQVGVFASFDAAFSRRQAQSEGSVDCSGRNGLGRRHLHLSACQRHCHEHAERRGCSRVVVGRKGDGNAGIDEAARVGIFLHTQKIIRTGDERSDGVMLGEERNIVVADVVEMIERGWMEAQQRF